MRVTPVATTGCSGARREPRFVSCIAAGAGPRSRHPPKPFTNLIIHTCAGVDEGSPFMGGAICPNVVSRVVTLMFTIRRRIPVSASTNQGPDIPVSPHHLNTLRLCSQTTSASNVHALRIATSAQLRQSRPDSGLCLPTKSVKPSKLLLPHSTAH